MANSVTIIVDAKDQASHVFKEIKDNAGGLGKTLGDVGKIAGGFLAGGAIAAGVGQFKSFISGSVNAAKDLGESLNAVKVTFGESAKTITDWGKANATAFGLSQREFNQLVTPLGAMLQNYGFSAEQAADQSINLAKRAADMASVFNVDVGQALEAIQAGLRGEADPLEKFGVGLNAAAIEGKALAMTGKAVASSLTDQEKKAAALALIFEQTDKVAGDFANTSDQLANKQRIAAARTEELQAKIGEKLIPVSLKITEIKLKLTEALVNKLIPALAAASKWFNQELYPILREIVDTKVIPEMQAALAQLQQTIDGLMPIAKGILEWFKENPAAIAAVTLALGLLLVALFPIPAAVLAIITAGTLLLAHWDEIKAKVSELVAKFKSDFPILWAVVDFVWDDIKNKIETTMAVIKDVIAIATALIHGDWDKAWNGIKQLVSDIFDGILTDVVNKLDLLKTLAVAAIQAIPPLLLVLVSSFYNAAVSLGDAVIRGIVDGVKGAAGVVGGIAADIGRAVKDWINSNVIDRINRALEFTIKIKNPIGPDPSVTINPPDIPRLAGGAIIRARPGGSLFVGGEGSQDEAIMPLPPGWQAANAAPTMGGQSFSMKELASAIGAELDQRVERLMRSLTITVDGREIGRVAMAYGGREADLYRRSG